MHWSGLTPAQAVARQRELAARVRITALTARVRRLAAVDCAIDRVTGGIRAAAVRLAWPGMARLAEATAVAEAVVPYIPGLLSFRELPAVLMALERLPERPDLVLCDGQGIAHPRRFGIASHLGVETGLASIGVGKSRLVGVHAEPGPARGDWTPLTDSGVRIGGVLRTRAGVRPLYVSPGHRVDHDDALNWVLATLGRYRLPEPIRAADRLAGAR